MPRGLATRVPGRLVPAGPRMRAEEFQARRLEEGPRAPALRPYSTPRPQTDLFPASRLTPSAPEGARQERRPAPSRRSPAEARGRGLQPGRGSACGFGGKTCLGQLTPTPLVCPERPLPSWVRDPAPALSWSSGPKLFAALRSPPETGVTAPRFRPGSRRGSPATGSPKVPGLEAVCTQTALLKRIIEILIKSVSSCLCGSQS